MVLAKLGEFACKYCAKSPELTEFTILVVNDEYSLPGLVLYSANVPLSGMVVCNNTSILYPCVLKNNSFKIRLAFKLVPMYFTNDALISIELEVATITAFWLW